MFLARVESASSSQSGVPKNETAWERGLREAREVRSIFSIFPSLMCILKLMKKSQQKKQDPEFERKRLLLPPSEDTEWRHESDDDRLASNCK